MLEAISRFFKLDGVIENLSGYVEARVQLLKIEVREDVSKALARAVVMGVLLLLAFLVLVFFSIGFALFLNRFFDDNFVGFWLVAGLYLALLGVALAMRTKIHRKVERLLNNRLQKKQ